MKCLLCRIANQHEELLKRRNNTTFVAMDALWHAFTELVRQPELRKREWASVRQCSVHQRAHHRDQWLEDILPKMGALARSGINIRMPRVPLTFWTTREKL